MNDPVESNEGAVAGSSPVHCSPCPICQKTGGNESCSYCCEDPNADDQGYEKATPYEGDPCPRRCTCCPDEDGDYPKEHHWMLEYGDEESPDFDPAGHLACRHCDATREIPIEDDEFLEAFGL